MKHSWLNTTEYPFQSRYLIVDGAEMHYIDEGEGDILLFVHGTPSWSFDFRKVITALSNSYRCIAVDHLGFGLSAKPRDFDYSTHRHSIRLEKFIDELGLTDINLVVHDFGGPVALNIAIKHPSLFQRLVILNSWLWSSATDPSFLKMKKLLQSPLLPFLYRYFNFSAKYLLPRSFGKQKLTQHLKTQYTRPFSECPEREGPLAFARSLLHDQPWFQNLWDQKRSIENKPTLLIWGMRDPLIGQSFLQKFQEGFSFSSTVEIPSAGHFPQEECPEIVASAISRFLKGARPPHNPAGPG